MKRAVCRHRCAWFRDCPRCMEVQAAWFEARAWKMARDIDARHRVGQEQQHQEKRRHLVRVRSGHQAIRSTAVIEGEYRYRLTRSWGPGEHVVFVMLNPSTADAEVNDPTIRRCMAFAKSWGASGIVVVNLFALRATDPKQLLRHRDPVGPDGDLWLGRTVGREPGRIVCAWGNGGAERSKRFLAWAEWYERALYCLDRTKSGQPIHPLYQPASRVPVPMNVAAAGKSSAHLPPTPSAPNIP